MVYPHHDGGDDGDDGDDDNDDDDDDTCTIHVSNCQPQCLFWPVSP